MALLETGAAQRSTLNAAHSADSCFGPQHPHVSGAAHRAWQPVTPSLSSLTCAAADERAIRFAAVS